MKIVASLAVGLALVSPVSCLRGTKIREENEQRQRRDQDAGEGLDRAKYTGVAELEPMDTYEAKEEAVTEDYAMLDEYRHKSSSKDSVDADFEGADELCQGFCDDYIEACVGANAFFDPDDANRGAPARRRLLPNDNLEVLKVDGTTVFQSLPDCLEACMQYPRPINPANYIEPRTLGVNSIGDTFWCRRTHLDLAMSSKTFAAQTHCPFAAPDGGGLCLNAPIMTTVPFGSSDDSGGDHYNYYPTAAPTPQPFVNGTVWDFIRAGAETARHLGYCTMYFNDLVADCTSAGIDDRTLPLALALIPMDTEIIILNNNVGKPDPVSKNKIGEGITEIPSQLFRGLVFPEGIRAVYIDDGNIRTIAADGFTALRNMQALSLNMQQLTSIPQGMLDNALQLRDFSIYNTKEKPGMLMSIPADLFISADGTRQTILNRVVISGHRGLTTLPSRLFLGQDRTLAVLILSNNGFVNPGITNTMFRNLNSLCIFDMSNNQFRTAEKAWFDGGWAQSLRAFYLQENPITVIEDNMFDFDACRLQTVLFHDTDAISIPVGLFNFCPELITYTISPRV